MLKNFGRAILYFVFSSDFIFILTGMNASMGTYLIYNGSFLGLINIAAMVYFYRIGKACQEIDFKVWMLKRENKELEDILVELQSMCNEIKKADNEQNTN